jgi:EpsI family protein
MGPKVILSAMLIAQGAAFYGLSRPEPVALASPLRTFPAMIGDWRAVRDGRIELDIGADDYLTRDYAGPAGETANLFVAFFQSQRAGASPHSPKNCLPGSGWTWTVSDTIPITVAGLRKPLEVNRYVVSKGSEQALVLYWYQSRDRVVASEYKAAALTAWDALRYHRTDAALVRIVIGIHDGGERAATAAGIQFVQSVFPQLRRYLPG